MSHLKKMEELRLQVPRPGLTVIRNENSPYVSYTGNVKNCYLLSGSEYDEDCYYGFWLYNSTDCTDCDYCQKCELCYDCVDCIECYGTNFSQDCTGSTDCEYCYDCGSCSDCFLCANLRRQKYMIQNKQFTREEYEKKVAELKQKHSREELLQMLEEIKRQVPHMCFHALNNENSSGDYIYNCKNSYWCYDAKELEDCAYCDHSISLKDCLDISNSYYNSELCYEVMSEMNLVNCNFCVTCFDSYNLDHCEHVYSSHDCFGCFSLKNAEYCIFNKKYTREEYEKKVAEIKKEMIESGEYTNFPCSTYPYEDSNAAMHWAKK